MGELTGFMKYGRKTASRRSIPVRIKDWKEVYEPFPDNELEVQGARCMDCGIPFCHEGCPLGNLIPEWNDLVFKGDFELAAERLHATNNFPDFTGRLCPAPCEGSCVLGINEDPVAIKQIEVGIVEELKAKMGLKPRIAEVKTGKEVAIIGSGPAGLAAAQQLARAGHSVTVFERAEKIGGLLRYGIPEFKMEKAVLDERLTQLESEGVVFVANTSIGGIEFIADRAVGGPLGSNCNVVPGSEVLAKFDAVLLAIGCTVPRNLNIEGRDLHGIHFAMEYLKRSNLVTEGSAAKSEIDANGKHVVIIGGGDTGADCLGTALRQGAKSITQLEILSKPPENRGTNNPWPTWPVIFRTSSAHEEGGDRLFSVTGSRFVGDDELNVKGLIIEEVHQVETDGRVTFETIEGTSREIPCDLCLLAMGFSGPEKSGLVAELGVELDGRGNIKVSDSWSTSVKKVFACGDSVRGQSLIVWAIAEGRSVAKAIDNYLTDESMLPSPLRPLQYAIS